MRLRSDKYWNRTLSIGRPSLDATVSMMRMLACQMFARHDQRNRQVGTENEMEAKIDDVKVYLGLREEPTLRL